MAAKHVTARGRPIDMHQMRIQNGRKPALGNASKNARGDLIDKKTNIVLKTQEQITAEWAAAKRQRELQIKPANIKSDTLMADLGVKASAPIKKVSAADQHFDAETMSAETTKPSRRRMTESDK